MARSVPRLAAALLLIAWAGAATPGAAAGPPGDVALRGLVRPGERAPAFVLQDLDGRAVSVAPGDGRPSLIVFFSVFCPLCRQLAPQIAGIAARRGPSLRVIGVNLDGQRFSATVRSFVREMAIPFPVLLDEIRGDLFVASDPYGVEKTPTAVLVDGRGLVREAAAADAMKDLVRDFDRILAALEKGDRVPE